MATLDADSSCNGKESQADGFLAAISGTGMTGGMTLPDGKVSAVELEGSILPE